MSCSTIKPTVWTLRKVLIRISLSMPLRLTRTLTLLHLWIFCFRTRYSIPQSLWYGIWRPGLACANCAGWYGLIHFAESTMLVFSRNGSYPDNSRSYIMCLVRAIQTQVFICLSVCICLWFNAKGLYEHIVITVFHDVIDTHIFRTIRLYTQK